MLPTQDPKLRDARLFNGTCTGAYFSSHTADCTVGIEAELDFGSNNPVTDFGARVTANLGGNQSYTLTYDTATGLWRSAAVIPVAAAAGPVSVNLHWEKRRGTSDGDSCGNGNNNPCKGDFLGAQRVFAGSTARSGPVQNMRVFEASEPLVDANSLERCSTCTHDLVVELALTPSLQNASSVSDPPVVLRLTGSGSLTQALDCDPTRASSRTRSPLAARPSYTKNRAPHARTTTCCGAPHSRGPASGPRRGSPRTRSPPGSTCACSATRRRRPAPHPTTGRASRTSRQSDPSIVQVFLTRFGSFAGRGRAPSRSPASRPST